MEVCHSEHSEESMQLIDNTGFLATLRMTIQKNVTRVDDDLRVFV